MPDDPDDTPSEFSELDLSEDTAITGEDVQETLGVEEGSVVRSDDEGSPTVDVEDEAGGAEGAP